MEQLDRDSAEIAMLKEYNLKNQEIVQNLRTVILKEAVTGKLAPQDPNDEAASDLLLRIGIQKEKTKRNKAKEDVEYSRIPQSEIPYELPERWVWCRLSDIGQIVGGGTPQTDKADYWAENGIAWLTPADLYNLNSRYITKGKRDISEKGLRESSAKLLPKGAVLFSSRAPIGYVAIANGPLSTNQGFKSVVPYLFEMSEYIYYFLKAAAKRIDLSASGTTFREISGSKMKKVLFPLPPLDEQKRIVKKIEQLECLCEELERKVKETQKHSAFLMEAVLKESFAF